MVSDDMVSDFEYSKTVLNVNRSLYSSKSRGRAQRVDLRTQGVDLRAQRARLYATPTFTTGEAPVYVYCLYSSFTTGRLQGGLPFNHYFRVSVCSVGNLKILKNIIKDMPPTGDGLL